VKSALRGSAFLRTRGYAARETLGYLDRRGIDTEPLLLNAGFSRRQLAQERGWISVVSQYQFLERAAIVTNNSVLGLHVAAEMELQAGGILFYLAASSATVSEALDNLVRYIATTNEALVGGVLRSEGEAVLTIRSIPKLDEPRRQHSEFIALWIMRTLHKVTSREFTASLITFAHSRSSDLRELHRLLRCPLAFEQAEDSLVLSKHVIDLPIASEDSYLLQILRAHADDQLAERRTSAGLQWMVEDQLLSLLPSGSVSAAMVARQLGMSERSLTRLLAQEGATFGEILDRLRQRLALRYLADSRVSLQQIAWMLGYSEAGAFNHAFKRWTGTSPGRARRRLTDGLSA